MTRGTHSSKMTGTYRQLMCHRFCDGLWCRGAVGDGGGRREEDDLRRKFLDFFADAVASLTT